MYEKICYCFDYTTDDIGKDIEQNGRSTIMERIMAEKKKGGCQCATRHPRGR
jgi:NAD(P)H-nitrite reductase large subunit